MELDEVLLIKRFISTEQSHSLESNHGNDHRMAEVFLFGVILTLNSHFHLGEREVIIPVSRLFRSTSHLFNAFLGLKASMDDQAHEQKTQSGGCQVDRFVHGQVRMREDMLPVHWSR